MDFGFSISPSSAINLDKVDFSLYDRLCEIEPDAKKCMACAGPWTGMSVRKVILGIQRGKEKEAAKMLKGCMLCGKCTMVCPRGINTRHLILSLCRIYGEDEK